MGLLVCSEHYLQEPGVIDMLVDRFGKFTVHTQDAIAQTVTLHFDCPEIPAGLDEYVVVMIYDHETGETNIARVYKQVAIATNGNIEIFWGDAIRIAFRKLIDESNGRR